MIRGNSFSHHLKKKREVFKNYLGPERKGSASKSSQR